MEMSSLSIASFNGKNIKSSIDAVRILCKWNDVALLQETWLTNVDMMTNQQWTWRLVFYQVGHMVGLPFYGANVLQPLLKQSNMMMVSFVG